jgi:hypothetical protein
LLFFHLFLAFLSINEKVKYKYGDHRDHEALLCFLPAI